MTTITLRRGGNLLELSQEGQPLPDDLEARLCRSMSYTHITHVRGWQAYHPTTGEHMPTRSERRALYDFDPSHRLLCPVGYMERLLNELVEWGYQVQFVDLDLAARAHPNPNRFRVDFDNLFRHMELRPRQADLMAEFLSRERAVGEAPGGFGKSELFRAFALALPEARIHIVVDGLAIQKRIVRGLTRSIANVGIVNGSTKRFSRVTVISADSLKNVDFTDRVTPRGADVVFLDEVHRLMAPKVSEILVNYREVHLYSVSATTTGRFDGADAKLEGLSGLTVFKMTYPEAVALGLVVPIRVEWLPVDGNNPCQDLLGTTKDRHGIWRNEVRNGILAGRVHQLDPEDQTLILVATLEHAVYLKQFLPEYRLCYSTGSARAETGRYDMFVRQGMLDPNNEPPMTDRRMDTMREEFEAGELKKVIATDVWSTGVDFTALQILVRADARCSEILDVQGPSRVSRTCHAIGKEEGLVIDCQDNFDNTYRRRYQERRRSYGRQGWEQTTLGERQRPTIYTGVSP